MPPQAKLDWLNTQIVYSATGGAEQRMGGCWWTITNVYFFSSSQPPYYSCIICHPHHWYLKKFLFIPIPVMIHINLYKIDVIHWNRLCFTAPCPCWFTPDKILPWSSQFMAPNPIELSCRKFKNSNIAATDKSEPTVVAHSNVQYSKVYL